MGFSPQDLEGMLDELERAGPSTPLGVSPEYFLPETKGAAGSVNTTSLGEAVRGVPSPSEPPPPQEPAHPHQAPASPQGVVVPRGDDKAPAEAFDEFSELKRPEGLPPGAREITCNQVIRDPDSGRIVKVLTYKLPEGSA